MIIDKQHVKKVQDLGEFVVNTCKQKFEHDINGKSYAKLSGKKQEVVRDLFNKCVNKLQLDSSKAIYTTDGVKIAEGFERIVVGDYGAYIEYDLSQVPQGVKYKIQSGEEYRLRQDYIKRVKYIWYTIGSTSPKIYWQLRTVSYADYKVKKFYISPYEVYQK